VIGRAQPVSDPSQKRSLQRFCEAALISLLFSFSNLASAQDQFQYKIVTEGDDSAPGKVLISSRNSAGKPGLYVTVQFKIVNLVDGRLANNIDKEEIVVEEDHRRVTDVEIYQPRARDPLTVVMVLDTSGSMTAEHKLDEAKEAARLFLKTLHDQVNVGLILFDHELRVVEPPAADPKDYAAHRDQLRKHIDAAQARGGTAYLDATARAVDMLRGFSGRKAVLLLTDGVDLNSKATLADVKKRARDAQVPVYTLGVGEPGKNEPVTTVLVLDHSGSMSAPADDVSRVPKIKALHKAAGQFVQLMRPGARTTLLPFSSTVGKPENFSDNKADLQRRIDALKPDGETALFDAVFAAVETLEAGRPPGKRSVVALTDGIDNSSRRRVDEVVERAREAHIPLHLLGLGRSGELDEKVMRAMAARTGGDFHHARNEDDLVQIFEDLSIQLHDDGFDERSLRELAEATGGKFYHARDASQLRILYENLAEELQSTYTVTFPSSRPTHDGTSRGIDISVVRSGRRLSAVAGLDYQVSGVVVSHLHQGVYLVLLAALGFLLLLPVGIKRMYRFYGGS
jgi:VWFA-related protein